MKSFDKISEAQNFLQAKKVPKIPAKPRTKLQRRLRDLYAQGGAESVVATIINVAMKQRRGAFLFTRASIDALIKVDPNRKVKNINAHYARTLLLLSKVGTFPFLVARKAQVFVFNTDLLLAIGVDSETANGQLQQCILGFTKKATAPAESLIAPQTQPDEVAETANEIFKIYGPDEAAWEDALEGHPKYEEVRELLKAMRNQSHRQMGA